MSALETLDAEDLVTVAHEHIDNLRRDLSALEAVAGHLTDRDSIAVVLYELHTLLVGFPTKGTPARSRLVLDEFKRALMSEAGSKTFDVPTIGRFEIRQAKKRSGWRYDELVPEIVKAGQRERRIIDPEAGEVEDEGFAVARAMRDCLSISGGKVTGLAKRGINADEYATVEDGSYDVMLPAPSEAR